MAQFHIGEGFNFEQQSYENPRCCIKLVAHFILENIVVLTLNFKISGWPAYCVYIR